MDQRTNIVIVGAGGLGRETLSTIRACNVAKDEWDVLGFLDSDPGLKGANVGGIPVLGNDSWIRENSHKPARFICAIGNPNLRLQVVEKLRAMDCKFASIIDPDVRIPDSIQIGAGTVIMGGTRFTTDAKIGSHVVIYMNCSITHDVCVGDFCLIPSGCNLSGGCVLEPGVQLGTGVSILPLRRVGAWSIIGAGSVVTDDIPSKSTAVGIPCRVIK